jgi:hypothetical protein
MENMVDVFSQSTAPNDKEKTVYFRRLFCRNPDEQNEACRQDSAVILYLYLATSKNRNADIRGTKEKGTKRKKGRKGRKRRKRKQNRHTQNKQENSINFNPSFVNSSAAGPSVAHIVFPQRSFTTLSISPNITHASSCISVSVVFKTHGDSIRLGREPATGRGGSAPPGARR